MTSKEKKCPMCDTPLLFFQGKLDQAGGTYLLTSVETCPNTKIDGEAHYTRWEPYENTTGVAAFRYEAISYADETNMFEPDRLKTSGWRTKS